MQKLPECCRIRADIRTIDAAQAGLILHVREDMGRGYYLGIEPERGRLLYRSWLRMYEEGGKTFPYDVELECPIRRAADGRYRLEVVLEGTAATAYVNDEAALSFRMYDLEGGNLGLFSLGRAVFADIEMQTE